MSWVIGGQLTLTERDSTRDCKLDHHRAVRLQDDGRQQAERRRLAGAGHDVAKWDTIGGLT